MSFYRSFIKTAETKYSMTTSSVQYAPTVLLAGINLAYIPMNGFEAPIIETSFQIQLVM